MALEKANDVLKAHFAKSAAHHDNLAGTCGKIAASHAAYAAVHSDAEGKKLHKTLGASYEKASKSHSDHAEHLRAVGETLDSEHAGKVLAAAGLTDASGQTMYDKILDLQDTPIRSFAIPWASGNQSGMGFPAGTIDTTGVPAEFADLVKTEF